MPPLDTNKLITIIVLAIGALLYYFYALRKRGEEGGGSLSSMTPMGRVLLTYTRDLSAAAEKGELDAVIGRHEEIERVIHILARRSKNNPLLLGEPGVGKTAVVEGIALRIAQNDVPGRLQGKRVLALDLGALISGTKYRGEFEQRMKKLTDELRVMGRAVILFIDEIHMIEQASGAEGAMNVSDILKPALSRGELQAIGATTWKEYERFIRPDDALNRRFQPVVIGEPSDEATLAILRGIKSVYEEHHHVIYEDDALVAAVKFSKKFIKDRYLPDKAIDLVDEAGAKVSIESSHNAKHAVGLLHAAGASAKNRLAKLRVERVELTKELIHLTRLEKAMPEPELSDIRRRMEHLLSEVGKMDKRVTQNTVGKTPVVRAKDIEEVAQEWSKRRT